MKKQLNVIEVPANGKPNWNKGAFVICFVYSKYKGNFILKGYFGEVEDYLKKNHTHYFCNMTLWSDHGHRDIWYFWKDSVGLSQPNNKGNKIRSKWNSKFMVYTYSKEKKERKELIFKRMPKCWIPEFDKF